jgi:fumarate reductase (CoM/CoB) subunit A
VIAVKGKLGRSGSSAMTSAGYSSAVTDADSPESHRSDTLKGGRMINDPELVAIMAEEAPGRLEELVELGGELALVDGMRVVHPSGDHAVPRTVVAANFKGLDFTLPLAQAVRAAGCGVLEHTMVADVLLDAGRVAGAVCLDRTRPDPVIEIAAPALILATGGAGQLFEVTSNPSDVTGDGYAIALRAGATLRDMEFIQFYPWRCIVPFDTARMPIQPSTFVAGARLLNADGERFMSAYDPVQHEATTRDIAARGIYDQIRTGRSVQGGVRLDLSRLSDDDWRRTNVRPSDYFERRGIDFRSVSMILAPEAHFFMGGLVTDAHGRSTVPGLFVAGETAGGVHGANRLDSNALPETQVFGARAGRAAARYAVEHPPPATGRATADAWRATHAALLAGPRLDGAEQADGGHPPAGRLLRSVQHTAWQKLGIVRDRERLEQGLEQLAAVGAALEDAAAPAGGSALVARFELRNLLAVGRACFSAALERTESRGAHYRLDYPAQDDAHWAEPLLVQQTSDGELTIRRLGTTSTPQLAAIDG